MQIGLFITCVTDTLFPQAGQATVEVLERLGQTVVFPRDQTCCGQMHANSGYQDQAMPMLRRFTRVFSDERLDAIVAPSGSCVAMVREQYPRLAAATGHSGLQRAVDDLIPNVFELSEFLVGKLAVTDVGAYFPHRVTYHPSCHSLRLLHVGDAPWRLLQAVGGIDLIKLPEAETCCGFGGTFSVKNADTSVAMLADKTRAIIETGAEVCAALDCSCLLQIGGGLSRLRTGVRTAHVAELLAATEHSP